MLDPTVSANTFPEDRFYTHPTGAVLPKPHAGMVDDIPEPQPEPQSRWSQLADIPRRVVTESVRQGYDLARVMDTYLTYSPAPGMREVMEGTPGAQLITVPASKIGIAGALYDVPEKQVWALPEEQAFKENAAVVTEEHEAIQRALKDWGIGTGTGPNDVVPSDSMIGQGVNWGLKLIEDTAGMGPALVAAVLAATGGGAAGMAVGGPPGAAVGAGLGAAAVGGGMEAAAELDRLIASGATKAEATAKMAAITAAVGVLNAVPIVGKFGQKFLSKIGSQRLHWLAQKAFAGAAEGVTEWAEGPTIQTIGAVVPGADEQRGIDMRKLGYSPITGEDAGDDAMATLQNIIGGGYNEMGVFVPASISGLLMSLLTGGKLKARAYRGRLISDTTKKSAEWAQANNTVASRDVEKDVDELIELSENEEITEHDVAAWSNALANGRGDKLKAFFRGQQRIMGTDVAHDAPDPERQQNFLYGLGLVKDTLANAEDKGAALHEMRTTLEEESQKHRADGKSSLVEDTILAYLDSVHGGPIVTQQEAETGQAPAKEKAKVDETASVSSSNIEVDTMDLLRGPEVTRYATERPAIPEQLTTPDARVTYLRTYWKMKDAAAKKKLDVSEDELQAAAMPVEVVEEVEEEDDGLLEEVAQTTADNEEVQAAFEATQPTVVDGEEVRLVAPEEFIAQHGEEEYNRRAALLARPTAPPVEVPSEVPAVEDVVVPAQATEPGTEEIEQEAPAEMPGAVEEVPSEEAVAPVAQEPAAPPAPVVPKQRVAPAPLLAVSQHPVLAEEQKLRNTMSPEQRALRERGDAEVEAASMEEAEELLAQQLASRKPILWKDIAAKVGAELGFMVEPGGPTKKYEKVREALREMGVLLYRDGIGRNLRKTGRLQYYIEAANEGEAVAKAVAAVRSAQERVTAPAERVAAPVRKNSVDARDIQGQEEAPTVPLAQFDEARQQELKELNGNPNTPSFMDADGNVDVAKLAQLIVGKQPTKMADGEYDARMRGARRRIRNWDSEKSGNSFVAVVRNGANDEARNWRKTKEGRAEAEWKANTAQPLTLGNTSGESARELYGADAELFGQEEEAVDATVEAEAAEGRRKVDALPRAKVEVVKSWLQGTEEQQAQARRFLALSQQEPPMEDSDLAELAQLESKVAEEAQQLLDEQSSPPMTAEPVESDAEITERAEQAVEQLSEEAPQEVKEEAKQEAKKRIRAQQKKVTETESKQLRILNFALEKVQNALRAAMDSRKVLDGREVLEPLSLALNDLALARKRAEKLGALTSEMEGLIQRAEAELLGAQHAENMLQRRAERTGRPLNTDRDMLMALAEEAGYEIREVTQEELRSLTPDSAIAEHGMTREEADKGLYGGLFDSKNKILYVAQEADLVDAVGKQRKQKWHLGHEFGHAALEGLANQTDDPWLAEQAKQLLARYGVEDAANVWADAYFSGDLDARKAPSIWASTMAALMRKMPTGLMRMLAKGRVWLTPRDVVVSMYGDRKLASLMKKGGESARLANLANVMTVQQEAFRQNEVEVDGVRGVRYASLVPKKAYAGLVRDHVSRLSAALDRPVTVAQVKQDVFEVESFGVVHTLDIGAAEVSLKDPTIPIASADMPNFERVENSLRTLSKALSFGTPAGVVWSLRDMEIPIGRYTSSRRPLDARVTKNGAVECWPMGYEKHLKVVFTPKFTFATNVDMQVTVFHEEGSDLQAALQHMEQVCFFAQAEHRQFNLVLARRTPAATIYNASKSHLAPSIGLTANDSSVLAQFGEVVWLFDRSILVNKRGEARPDVYMGADDAFAFTLKHIFKTLGTDIDGLSTKELAKALRIFVPADVAVPLGYSTHLQQLFQTHLGIDPEYYSHSEMFGGLSEALQVAGLARGPVDATMEILRALWNKTDRPRRATSMFNLSPTPGMREAEIRNWSTLQMLAQSLWKHEWDPENQYSSIEARNFDEFVLAQRQHLLEYGTRSGMMEQKVMRPVSFNEATGVLVPEGKHKEALVRAGVTAPIEVIDTYDVHQERTMLEHHKLYASVVQKRSGVRLNEWRSPAEGWLLQAARESGIPVNNRTITGEDLYRTVMDHFGSAEGAAAWFASQGIAGQRLHVKEGGKRAAATDIIGTYDALEIPELAQKDTPTNWVTRQQKLGRTIEEVEEDISGMPHEDKFRDAIRKRKVKLIVDNAGKLRDAGADGWYAFTRAKEMVEQDWNVTAERLEQAMEGYDFRKVRNAQVVEAELAELETLAHSSHTPKDQLKAIANAREELHQELRNLGGMGPTVKGMGRFNMYVVHTADRWLARALNIRKYGRIIGAPKLADQLWRSGGERELQFGRALRRMRSISDKVHKVTKNYHEAQAFFEHATFRLENDYRYMQGAGANYWATLTPEQQSVMNEVVAEAREYYETMQAEMKERGYGADFVKSRLEKRTKEYNQAYREVEKLREIVRREEAKNPESKRAIEAKKKLAKAVDAERKYKEEMKVLMGLRYVNVPVSAIDKRKQGARVSTQKERETLSVWSLVSGEQSVLRQRDCNILDIMCAYGEHVAMDIALAECVRAAYQDGVAMVAVDKETPPPGYVPFAADHPVFNKVWMKESARDFLYNNTLRGYMNGPIAKQWRSVANYKKAASFYNPAVMPGLNFQQLWQLGIDPASAGTQLVMKKLRKEREELAPEYQEYLRSGAASNPHGAPLSTHGQLLRLKRGGGYAVNALRSATFAGTRLELESSSGEKWRALTEVFGDNVVTAYYDFAMDLTWSIDDLQRYLAYKTMRGRGYTQTQAGTAVAEAMGDYGNIPKATRIYSGMLFFTPSYWISTMRYSAKTLINGLGAAKSMATGKGLGAKHKVALTSIGMGILYLCMQEAIMAAMGFGRDTDEDWWDALPFRKYSKRIFSEKLGREKELVAVLNSPTLAPLREFQRMMNVVSGRGGLEGLLHPFITQTFRALVPFAVGGVATNAWGQEIYSEFDSTSTKLGKTAKYLLTGFVPLMETVFSNRPMDTAAQEELEGWKHVYDISLGYFMSLYTREVPERRAYIKAKGIIGRYKSEVFKKIANGESVPEEWAENVRKALEAEAGRQ